MKARTMKIYCNRLCTSSSLCRECSKSTTNTNSQTTQPDSASIISTYLPASASADNRHRHPSAPSASSTLVEQSINFQCHRLANIVSPSTVLPFRRSIGKHHDRQDYLLFVPPTSARLGICSGVHVPVIGYWEQAIVAELRRNFSSSTPAILIPSAICYPTSFHHAPIEHISQKCFVPFIG